MTLLKELFGISKVQPPEPAPLDINRIRQKAAAFHAAQPPQQKLVPRAPTAQSVIGINDIDQFKKAVVKLPNAELQNLHVGLKRANNDPLVQAKRQIVFDELTGGRRPEQGYGDEGSWNRDWGTPKGKAPPPFTFK